MFLIFNKEYRQFEKIMSELYKKAKKSQKMTVKQDPETYELDTVNVAFDVVKDVLTVTDKAGEEIVSFNCRYSGNDELQNAKFNMFSDLLSRFREIYGARQEKQKMNRAAQAVKEKAELNAKQKAAEARKNQALADAYEKLRGM